MCVLELTVFHKPQTLHVLRKHSHEEPVRYISRAITCCITCVFVELISSSPLFFLHCKDTADSMSAALQGATDEDFERSAHWLVDIIKGYLLPRTAVRFLRRVVEIIQTQPGYHDGPNMCQGFCAQPNCHKVCARASDYHRHCRCFHHQMENMRDRHCNR